MHITSGFCYKPEGCIIWPFCLPKMVSVSGIEFRVGRIFGAAAVVATFIMLYMYYGSGSGNNNNNNVRTLHIYYRSIIVFRLS